MEGQGNITYAGPSGSASDAIIDANDGLSNVANVAKLGQSVGAAGNPAALTEDREIPFGGNRLFLGLDDGFDSVILVDPDDGIEISNDNGPRISLTGLGTSWTKQIVTSALIQESIGAGQINYDDTLRAESYGNSMYFRNAVTSVNSGTGIFNAENDLILVDTTIGNQVITFQTVANYPGKRGWIKKVSTDANTVTLNFASGGSSFIGSTGPVSTLTITTPGECLEFVASGGNIYII